MPIQSSNEYGWYTQYSGGTDEERRALPSYHPYALPRHESDEHVCRDGACPDTNWGGYDRLHSRGPECPPVRKVQTDEDIFAAAGIPVGEPESPAEFCTIGKWHANDANGDNLDCGSAWMIVDGNKPDGNYPGLVASVHRVLRG